MKEEHRGDSNHLFYHLQMSASETRFWWSTFSAVISAFKNKSVKIKFLQSHPPEQMDSWRSEQETKSRAKWFQKKRSSKLNEVMWQSPMCQVQHRWQNPDHICNLLWLAKPRVTQELLQMERFRVRQVWGVPMPGVHSSSQSLTSWDTGPHYYLQDARKPWTKEVAPRWELKAGGHQKGQQPQLNWGNKTKSWNPDEITVLQSDRSRIPF